MKKVLMSLLLAVCLVTGMMPQMAVKAETVSLEDMVDIGDTTVRSVSALENALQGVADVTQDSTGYITVSLQKNIVGRINFMLQENVIFNANGHVISGGTYAEPICLDHGSSYISSGNYGTVELVGNGIYVEGKNNTLFSGISRKLVIKSGVVLGCINRWGGVVATALEDGHDNYDVKSVTADSGNTSYTVNDYYVLNEGNGSTKTLEKCTEEVSFSSSYIYDIAVVPNSSVNTNIGDLTFESAEEVVSRLAGVADVTTSGAITINIKLKENIKGRLNFAIQGANIILDANGKTIDGTGTNEAVCLEHNYGQTIELTGNGTYITGINYAAYCGNGSQKLIIKSGIFEGRVYSETGSYTIALEGSKTSFDICNITKTPNGNYELGEATNYTTETSITDKKNFAVISGGTENLSWDNNYTYDKDYHWTECPDIGVTTGTAIHTTGDWVVDTPATIEQEGIKHRECTVCHAVETEVIPKLPSSNDSSNTGNDNNNTGNDNSNTGNNNSSTVTPDPAPEPQKPETKQITMVTKVQTTNGKLKLTWAPVEGADGYSIYTSVCDGKNNYKKQKDTTKQTVTLSNLTGNKPYKLYIAAYKLEDGNRVELSKTIVLHIAVDSSTYTNAKSIKTEKTRYTLEIGKSEKITAKTIKQDRSKKLVKHASEFRYISSDESVATVAKDGTITATGAGSCSIYVIANNGVYKEIHVTVK